MEDVDFLAIPSTVGPVVRLWLRGDVEGVCRDGYFAQKGLTLLCIWSPVLRRGLEMVGLQQIGLCRVAVLVKVLRGKSNFVIPVNGERIQRKVLEV